MTAKFQEVSKIKLLLVDDDPAIVRLLAKIIDRTFGDNVEMRCLTDPAEARSVVEDDLVDILITDLEMPGINSLELLRCAKRRNALTQVLFVTGHSSLDALTDALELGATDYLLKPFDQTELVAILEQSHERVRRWREALAGTFDARRKQATIATC